MRKLPLVLLVSALAFAAGCGKKGPLYLRESPPPGIKPAKPAPQPPVPYPPELSEEEKK